MIWGRTLKRLEEVFTYPERRSRELTLKMVQDFLQELGFARRHVVAVQITYFGETERIPWADIIWMLWYERGSVGAHKPASYTELERHFKKRARSRLSRFPRVEFAYDRKEGKLKLIAITRM